MLFKRKKRPPGRPRRERLRHGDHDIPFTLIRTDRRTIGIQVKREGEVVVRAPRRISEADIRAFVETRAAWIEKHLARFRETRRPPLQYTDGEDHYYLGEPLRLRVIPAARSGARRDGQTIVIRSPEPDNPLKTEAILKRWYKREAGRMLPPRVEALFPPFAALGHPLPAIRFRWMKRQWGSLSARGIMTLNTRLVLAPLSLSDYVIVHELCHLEHMNHGRGFHALLLDTMPDWKPRKRALEAFLA